MVKVPFLDAQKKFFWVFVYSTTSYCILWQWLVPLINYAIGPSTLNQCTLILLCVQYSWTEFLYMWLYSFLMNLYNKTKHTTISHGCYAGVQFIPATSLVRPTIFGLWVTAIDRFHCTMVTPWHQKEPCVHITSTMAESGKRATAHPRLSEPLWSGGCSDKDNC